MDFLDLHTHKTAAKPGVTAIESLSLTSDIFLAMPKKKPISIGLHPWYAKVDNLALQMKYLRVLAKQENVKLIGECGLDNLRGEEIENQLLILNQQIKLAEELNKPLILHCVKAFDELISLKKRLNVQVPMIIHGFNKNEELGNQLVSKGFLLSFGASVLKDNSSIAKLIKNLDFFFLETDDSETTIQEIYHAIAEIKKCNMDELKAIIFGNWKKLNLI
ncbi:MAG: hydrolase TatD [Pedobacter sp.]|nr:MAG: hydrolase TatD [Pedobacter sp.]